MTYSGIRFANSREFKFSTKNSRPSQLADNLGGSPLPDTEYARELSNMILEAEPAFKAGTLPVLGHADRARHKQVWDVAESGLVTVISG